MGTDTGAVGLALGGGSGGGCQSGKKETYAIL